MWQNDSNKVTTQSKQTNKKSLTQQRKVSLNKWDPSNLIAQEKNRTYKMLKTTENNDLLNRGTLNLTS